MEEYLLTIDRKVSMWIREHVVVEAETQDEAIQKCLDDDYDTDYVEDLYDTVEYLEPEEYPTVEIYNETDADPIYTNNPYKQ